MRLFKYNKFAANARETTLEPRDSDPHAACAAGKCFTPLVVAHFHNKLLCGECRRNYI